MIGDALLDEVTALVEWPVPLAGRFDAAFLELPQEVPIATMQDHQRYFPVRCRRPADAVVRHRVEHREQRPRAVIAGNERVVRPRLSDAAFFYGHRPQGALESHAAALARVDVPDPARLAGGQDRPVRALARDIATAIGGDAALADRAAELSKCDLLTAMVGEFRSCRA